MMARDIYKNPEQHVAYIPGPGCWLWLGKWSRKGYGRVIMGTKQPQAHRVFWERANGPIPNGLCVLHKCDTPACVNPGHLFLGTQAENMADMDRKGRRVNHEVWRYSEPKKLNWDKVRKIRSLKGLHNNREIGRMFGITPQMVGYILREVLWKEDKV